MDKYPKFALHRNDQLCEAIARVLYADDKKIKEKIEVEENSDMAIYCINWAVRHLSGRLRKYKETLHEHRQQLNDQNKSIAVQNTAIKDSEAKILEAGQIRDTALEALDKTLFKSGDNEIHKKLVEQDTVPEDVHSLFKMYTKLFALCPGPKKNGEEEQAGDEGDKQDEPDDEAEEGHLEIGARVEGNYRGDDVWYPGTLGRKCANGTFDINYDDGGRELSVSKDCIRLLPLLELEEGELEEGARVEGNYRGRGKWYPGVIGCERANGTFDINYDDGERELGVDRDLVRLMDSSGSHLEVEEEQSEDDRKEEWLTMREQFKDRVAWHQSMITAQQGISEKSQGDLDTIVKPLQSSKDIHGEFDLSFLKLNSSGADIMKPLRDWLIATISGQEHVLLVAESKSLLETLHETVPRSKAHVDKYMDKCNVCIRAKEICALYPKVQPDTWHYVSFLVDPSAGTIKIYIDAVLADEEEGIDPSLLTLQRTFVAFGGGERASNKGGDIYDLTIIGAKNLDDQAASKEYRHSQMRHVTMQESATKISASYRGHNQRSKLVLANEDYKLFYEDSDCIRQLSAPHMKDKQEKAAENYDSNDSDSEIPYYDSEE